MLSELVLIIIMFFPRILILIQGILIYLLEILNTILQGWRHWKLAHTAVRMYGVGATLMRVHSMAGPCVCTAERSNWVSCPICQAWGGEGGGGCETDAAQSCRSLTSATASSPHAATCTQGEGERTSQRCWNDTGSHSQSWRGRLGTMYRQRLLARTSRQGWPGGALGR